MCMTLAIGKWYVNVLHKEFINNFNNVRDIWELFLVVELLMFHFLRSALDGPSSICVEFRRTDSTISLYSQAKPCDRASQNKALLCHWRDDNRRPNSLSQHRPPRSADAVLAKSSCQKEEELSYRRLETTPENQGRKWRKHYRNTLIRVTEALLTACSGTLCMLTIRKSASVKWRQSI